PLPDLSAAHPHLGAFPTRRSSDLDLKPENILIDRWKHWRIADFGLARVHGEDKTGASGTPSFAAPEQLLDEAQSPAVDLFAMAGDLKSTRLNSSHSQISYAVFCLK